jgi:hypothetical protein
MIGSSIPTIPVAPLNSFSGEFKNASQEVVTILFQKKVTRQESKKPIPQGRFKYQTEKTNASRNLS